MSSPSATLALTFDDGPDPVWTPAVLEQLSADGVRATFFVLGERVRASPGLIAEITGAGHTVGLHGDAHLDHTIATRDQLAADTHAALITLQEVGVEPTLWRLPWGRVGAATADLAAHHELEIVGWDLDTHDWRGDTWADQPIERKAAARAGGIVLLHDAIGPGAPRTGCANTVELVEQLVRAATDAGIGVSTVTSSGSVHA